MVGRSGIGGRGGTGGAGGQGGVGGGGGGALQIAARGAVMVHSGSTFLALGGDAPNVGAPFGPANGAAGTLGSDGADGSGGQAGTSNGGDGGDGGDGGRGGAGGRGGDGARGGGGAGGTIMLVGTTIDLRQANDPFHPFEISASGGIGGQAGGLGRLVFASNDADPGLDLGIVNARIEDSFAGPRDANPFLPTAFAQTPLIAGLSGGADVFGLLAGITSNDLDYDPTTPELEPVPASEANALAAVMRLDVDPTGYGVDYEGFDMLLVANLTNRPLSLPRLGIASPGETTSLSDLKTRGLASERHLESLAPGAVWATLVPETTLTVSVTALGIPIDSGDSLAIRPIREESLDVGSVRFLRATQSPSQLLDKVNGLDSIAVSPDGRHLYVVSASANSLTVINTADQSHRQTFKDGVDGIDGLLGARDVLVTPNGRTVLVASPIENKLAVFTRDLSTGNLSPRQIVPHDFEGDLASLEFSSDSSLVYVSSSAGIGVYEFKPNQLLDFVPSNLSTGAISDLASSSDGELLIAADRESNQLRTFRTESSPRVTDVDVTIDIDHDRVDELTVFLVSPSGRTVRLFRDVGGTGREFQNTTLDDEATRLISFGSAPFVGSYRPQQPLSFFDGEQPDGTWTLRIIDEVGLSFPTINSGRLNRWSIKLTTSDNVVRSYQDSPFRTIGTIFGNDSNIEASLEVARAWTPLAPVETLDGSLIEGLQGASAVAMSTDDRFVYVTATQENAVSVFERDLVSDRLGLVQVVRNGSGDVRGLLAASGVSVSPDGDYVFVSSLTNDSLAVFGRDPQTGLLTYLQLIRNGIGGVSNMNGPRAVLATESAELYVASEGDGISGGGLARFEVETGTPQPFERLTIFDSIESLSVTTSDSSDTLTIRSVTSDTVIRTDLNTGAGNDSIFLFDASPVTRVNLGAGDDNATLETTTFGINLQVDGQAGEDVIRLNRLVQTRR